ncbi:MAG: zinc ribbon domain-containing protein [Syntrophobacteraceae bacterium]|nr:zinc ribbon domain-containing protein [Syntrophobacteraceae bacterium]
MPIFEFSCPSCGNVFEKIVYGNSEEVRCEKCGGSEVTKLLSTPSSLSGVRAEGRLPGAGDTGCCGGSPSSKGCVPGSCCGRAMT